MFEVLSTFPNNRGEITIWIRSNGYHSMPRLATGQNVLEYLSENYPMLEVVKNETFQ